MTTTPVDMMSEAWIDKIEAETKPSEQTFNTSKKMAVKKTSSSLATRGLDSFLAFQSKEFISFLRGCGFMDVNIYSAMENAVEEHTSYQAHFEKAAELGMNDPLIELGVDAFKLIK